MPIESGYTGGYSQPRKTTSFIGGGGSFGSTSAPAKTVNAPVAKTPVKTKTPISLAPKTTTTTTPKKKTPINLSPPTPSYSSGSTSRSSGSSFSGGGGSYSPSPTSWDSGGGSFGGGALGTSSTGTLSSFAPEPYTPPPPPPRWEDLDPAAQENYLAGDATFVAQRAALLQQLADQESALNADVDNYGIDTEKTMRNLGLHGGRFDPEKDAFEGGQWNPEDRIGAYGMAFGNQENDFGARGMLDSSGYDRAFGDMNTSFNRQKGDVIDALGTFVRNANQRKTEAKNTTDKDVQRARADAIARRAANLGLSI